MENFNFCAVALVYVGSLKFDRTNKTTLGLLELT